MLDLSSSDLTEEIDVVGAPQKHIKNRVKIFKINHESLIYIILLIEYKSNYFMSTM
jgi:hypothetical protein